MPHPADTNWDVRLDLAYDINHRSHARRLTNEQAANQNDEQSILKSAGTSGNRDHLDCYSSELETEISKGINSFIRKLKQKVLIR